MKKIGIVFLIGLLAGLLLMLKLTDKNKGEILTQREIVDEETVVTRVVEEATPSVVTVSILKTQIMFTVIQAILLKLRQRLITETED